jgi:import inner membrane translocase subunit TIM44
MPRTLTVMTRRTFATTESEKSESLKDTVHRLKGDKGDSTQQTTKIVDTNDFFRSLGGIADRVKSELSTAWQELLAAGQPKDINKKIHYPVATAEGEKPYDGPVDIMVIDPAEQLTAWQRMQKRLTEAPIIQDVLERANVVYTASGAKSAKARVDDLKEDAREAWETSQNPWVYRISSVYETITSETPESQAVAELRQLDPEFTLEDWKTDVLEHTLPQIMHWFLEGKINQLKPWFGEGVFKRIAGEITARQKEGFEIDSHMLGIFNGEILACEVRLNANEKAGGLIIKASTCELTLFIPPFRILLLLQPDTVNKGSPLIILHYMCQQIHCTRKNGEIVEGGESDIRANSYVVAFQREYDAELGELNWKIVDFRFNGAITYI